VCVVCGLCGLVNGYKRIRKPEDAGSIFLRNVGIHLADYKNLKMTIILSRVLALTVEL
jgi:hypothetical protein